MPDGDGCGAALDWWFRDAIISSEEGAAAEGAGPESQAQAEAGLTMADLPAACRQVLLAP